MTLKGSQSPGFELRSTGGGTVSLASELEDGPAIVHVNRGHWCSFSGEQLQTLSKVGDDLRFHDDVSVLPIVVDPLQRVTEMRDRYDLRIQLLADPDGEVAELYSGTDQTSHGLTGISATYVIDQDGIDQYEHVGDHAADRTYGNLLRYFIRNDYEDPYGE